MFVIPNFARDWAWRGLLPAVIRYVTEIICWCWVDSFILNQKEVPVFIYHYKPPQEGPLGFKLDGLQKRKQVL